MANTSSRTLRLLSLLQTHRYWSGSELAARLDVSPRTLRRDIDRLRELGYPVQAQPGVEGGYQLAAGATLPPLVIDDEEAVALVVGLQSAAQGVEGGVGEAIAEASVRVLAKVVQVMPPRLRRRAEALRSVTVTAGRLGPGVDPEVLTAIAPACRDSEQLRFAYTAADGARSDRLVEPHRLVCVGRRWYLVAYDLNRHGWRQFRVDRITAPRSIGTRFRMRDLPAADAAEFVRVGLENIPGSYQVEVLVDAPAAIVRDRIGRWSTVTEIDAEHCRVAMTADTLDWLIMALGMAGADFRVVQPPELRDRLREWSHRFNRAVGVGR